MFLSLMECVARRRSSRVETHAPSSQIEEGLMLGRIALP